MAWPHDNVLGGATKQRISYDQLSLTQFIQGFTRNILDESDEKIREQMLWYMSDLIGGCHRLFVGECQGCPCCAPLRDGEGHSMLVRYKSYRSDQKGSCPKT